jgi:hypothetical protein
MVPFRMKNRYTFALCRIFLPGRSYASAEEFKDSQGVDTSITSFTGRLVMRGFAGGSWITSFGSSTPIQRICKQLQYGDRSTALQVLMVRNLEPDISSAIGRSIERGIRREAGVLVPDGDPELCSPTSLTRFLNSMGYSKGVLLATDELIFEDCIYEFIEDEALAMIDMEKIKTLRLLHCNLDDDHLFDQTCQQSSRSSLSLRLDLRLEHSVKGLD